MTTIVESAASSVAAKTQRRPRLGFLGLGWIGRHRLEALQRSGIAQVAAVADVIPESRQAAVRLAPDACCRQSLAELLEQPLDGLVIATPSALHAGQALEALERGLAVFCQKPLARTTAETRLLVDAARSAGQLLGVDFSYRFIAGVDAMRAIVQSQAIGNVYAVDLVFHNAYGPDKAWFYDPALAGGGCLIDLGTHLIDLALWMLDYPPLAQVESRLYAQGELLREAHGKVEDYVAAQLTFATGTTAQLACSWRLSAGRDAVIEATFYGTKGAVSLHNLDGSFYNFTVERWQGTRREPLAAPDADWGGGAIIDWATRLAAGQHLEDQSARGLIEVAATVDAIYQR